MCIIHEQLDRLALQIIAFNTLRLPFLHQLVVEFDQQQNLVLYVGKEVIFPDEVKDVRTP